MKMKDDSTMGKCVVCLVTLCMFSAVFLTPLVSHAQQRSPRYEPFDLNKRLEALHQSDEWKNASQEMQQKLEKEIYDDWADYGGGLPVEYVQDRVIFDPQRGFGSVSGRVVDDSGRLLSGVSVSFLGYELGPGAAVRERRLPPVITDSQGRFVALKVYANWNILSLEIPWKTGFPHYDMSGEDLSLPATLKKRELEANFSWKPEIAVLVEKDKTTDVGDVAFALPLTVRGRVTLDGKPQANVCVVRLKPGVHLQQNRGIVCLTDKDGYFEYCVFPPLCDRLVIGVFERTAVFKTSESFMSAKSFEAKKLGAKRTVELNFDLKPFARLEFEIDCKETEYIGVQGLGSFCYFFENDTPDSPTNSYVYVLQGSERRTVRVQPGTYDICLADIGTTPWRWLYDVVLAPGETRRERFVVDPDDYTAIEGSVRFEYGEKHFTLAELGKAFESFEEVGLVRSNPSELAALRGFLVGHLSLFQVIPGFDARRVLPFVQPRFEDGKVFLMALHVPESTLEFWTVKDGLLASVYKEGLAFWLDRMQKPTVEPGFQTYNRMCKLWSLPLSDKSVPANLDIKVKLLDLLHAFLDWVNLAETTDVGRMSPQYPRVGVEIEWIANERKRLCTVLREFLARQDIGKLSETDRTSLDKFFLRLAEYETKSSFRMVKPQ